MDPNLLLLSLVLVAMHVGHAASLHEENTGTGLVNVNTGTGTHVGVGPGGVHVSTGGGKGTNVDVGHGGVGVNVHGKGKGAPYVGVGHGGVNVNAGHGGTRVSAGKGGVGVNTGGGTHVGVGHGGVVVTVPLPGKGKRGPYVSVGHGAVDPFNYQYEASETQMHDDPQKALFFLESDLHPGSKMKLDFGEAAMGTSLLPRRSAALPEVLETFSVEQGTEEAAAMEKTLKECNAPAAEGETKLCVTSLESMVDFTKSSLGTPHVTSISTKPATAGGESAGEQEYKVTKSVRVPGTKLVACHAQPYPYTVFYCHSTGTTRAYKVGMEGEKESAVVEAVAVCHEDTAGWNPKHLAFQVLKVKPGTVPVCHFLPQDHVVWTPRV